MNSKKNVGIAMVAAISVLASGCASMYGGESLSDDKIKSDIATSLGMDDPSGVSIESRKSEGVNTTVRIKTKQGVKMICNIIGGGIMAFGMRTIPSCSKIGKDGLPVDNAYSCDPTSKAAGRCK